MPWDNIERHKEVIIMKEQLDSIALGLQKVSIQLDNYHTNSKTYRESMEEEMARIKLTLYGNGQPGLTTRVNNVEGINKTLENHIKSDFRWMLFISSLLVTILGWTIFKV